MDYNFFNRFVFICRNCTEVSEDVLDIFSLSNGTPHTFKCSICGENCGEVKKTLSDHRFKLSGICSVCGVAAERKITLSQLLQSNENRISCPKCGSGILFWNNYRMDSTEYDLQADDSEENSITSFEMMGMIRKLLKTHSVSCICGSIDIDVGINNNYIVLKCINCGRKRSFHISNDNLARLINTSGIILGD